MRFIIVGHDLFQGGAAAGAQEVKKQGTAIRCSLLLNQNPVSCVRA